MVGSAQGHPLGWPIPLIDSKKDASLLGSVYPQLTDADDSVREKARRCVRDLGSKDSAPALVAAAAQADDDHQRVEFGEALLELGDLHGVPPILDVLTRGEATQARKDAWEHLRAHLPIPPELSEPAGAELERWWNEHEHKLAPQPGGTFKLQP